MNVVDGLKIWHKRFGEVQSLAELRQCQRGVFALLWQRLKELSGSLPGLRVKVELLQISVALHVEREKIGLGEAQILGWQMVVGRLRERHFDLLPVVMPGESLTDGEPRHALKRLADESACACTVLMDELAPASVAAEPVTADAVGQYVFRQSTGALWELRYENEAAQMLDAKGLQRIWKLLQSDERGISAAELVGADVAENVENLSSDAGGQVADREAVSVIEGKIKGLQLEIDDAVNPDRKAELEDEQRQLAAQLQSTKTTAGRARNMQRTPSEKAATAVRNSITAAINALQKPMPRFHTYLKERIQTGQTCFFINSGDNWQTDPMPT